MKENAGLKKELEGLNSKVAGDNCPDTLKLKINELNTRVANLKKDNTAKSKEIGGLASTIEKLNFDMKQVTDYVSSELQ